MGLDEEQEVEIRADILYFLYRNNHWQKRHTPKSNICNKLSQHPCKEINTGSVGRNYCVLITVQILTKFSIFY